MKAKLSIAIALIVLVVAFFVWRRHDAPALPPATATTTPAAPRAHLPTLSPHAQASAATQQRVHAFVDHYLAALASGDKAAVRRMIDARALMTEDNQHLVESLAPGANVTPQPITPESVAEFETMTVDVLLQQPQADRDQWAKQAQVVDIVEADDGKLLVRLSATITRQPPNDPRGFVMKPSSQAPEPVPETRVMELGGDDLRVISWAR